MQYKVTILYTNSQILILEWKYCYFSILLELDCWKLHKTILQGVLEAEKLEKQKCASNWLKPHYLPFQIWYSHYFFGHNFLNYTPRIQIMWFLDSARNELVKNVQNHFSRCFGSREMSKTKVGTFFLNTLYVLVHWSLPLLCYELKFQIS